MRSKLAGLEALAPEDLEKHLIRNSNRPRTFEDACLEIVIETGVRGHSDPVDVDAVNSLASGEGTG